MLVPLDHTHLLLVQMGPIQITQELLSAIHVLQVITAPTELQQLSALLATIAPLALGQTLSHAQQALTVQCRE